MQKIRYVKTEDKSAWYIFDHHLPDEVFFEKVRSQQGYVLLEEERAD